MCALLVAALLAPTTAWAQSDDDLLDFGPSETKPAKPAPPAAPVSEPEPDDQPQVITEEVEAAPEEPSAAEPAEEEPQPTTNVDPRSLDRIKAVPRKSMLKAMRLELSPFVALSLNDAYFQHFSAGGTLVFYPHDSFGFGLGAQYIFADLETSNIDVVRVTQSSVLAEFEPAKLFAHADLYWVPIYGKVSLFSTGILHFDFYVAAGGGIATAFNGSTPPLLTVGLGQRVTIGDWVAVRLEVRDYLYVASQEVDNIARTDTQNYLMLQLGVSFFVPPSFEYGVP